VLILSEFKSAFSALQPEITRHLMGILQVHLGKPTSSWFSMARGFWNRKGYRPDALPASQPTAYWST